MSVLNVLCALSRDFAVKELISCNYYFAYLRSV